MKTGMFDQGIINGFGRIMDLTDKVVNVGYFQDDKQHGKNIKFSSGMKIVEGIWKSNNLIK